MQSSTLSFSTEELNIILAGLGELPAKVSIDVIKKIQSIAQTTTPKELESIGLPDDV